MKKSIIISMVAVISFGVMALPNTPIDKVYYATSAKKVAVGGFYVGCTVGSHRSWGVKTQYVKDFSEYEIDCTKLGKRPGRRW